MNARMKRKLEGRKLLNHTRNLLFLFATISAGSSFMCSRRILRWSSKEHSSRTGTQEVLLEWTKWRLLERALLAEQGGGAEARGEKSEGQINGKSGLEVIHESTVLGHLLVERGEIN